MTGPALAAACLALAVTGCAAALGPLSPGLSDARAELHRIAAGAPEGEARDACAAAEEAIDTAERVAGPAGDDDAYVARRMVERARLAVLLAAEQEALEKARAAVRRLAADDARREALFARLARERRETAEAVDRARAARRRALLEAQAAGGEILEVPEGLLFRLPARELFLPGTSLFRAGAVDRLAALAAALRGPPACDVCLQVLDDVAGAHTSPALLAARRRARIRNALRAGGVPEEAFVPAPRRPPAGTQVDVLAIERPPPVPTGP